MTQPHAASFRKGSGLDDDEESFDSTVREAPTPDEPANGVMYEFSVAPKHQYYTCDIGERYFQVNDCATTYLSNYLLPCADYDLITEVSYPKYLRFIPSTKCRIHFHGYVTFRNIGFFLGEYSHHLLEHCTFKISTLRPEVWEKYITKQRHFMEEQLGAIYRLSGRRSLSLAPQAPRESVQKRSGLQSGCPKVSTTRSRVSVGTGVDPTSSTAISSRKSLKGLKD